MSTKLSYARRLEQIELANEQAIDQAIRSLVEITGDRPKSPNERSPHMLDEGYEGALLDAVKTIGKFLGAPRRGPFQVDSEPSFEDQVARVARQMGLEARRVTLSGQWWKSSHGPLLVFTKDDQILSALPKAWGGYGLSRKVPLGSIQEHAYSFHRTLDEEPIGLGQLLGVLSCAENHRDLLYVLLLGGVSSLLALAVPFLTGMAVERAIPESDRALLVAVGLGIFAVTFGNANFNLFRSILFNRLNSRFDLSVPLSLVDRLVRLPAAFFRQFSSGELSDRVFGVSDVVKSSTNAGLESLASFFFSFFYLGLIFFYSPLLGAISLGGSLIIVLVGLLGNIAIYNLQKLFAQENGKLSGLVVQMLRGIDKLRVANAHQRAFAKWSERYAWMRRRYFKSSMIAGGLDVFSQVAAVFLHCALLIVFFGLATQEGPDKLGIGDFMVISTAFGSFQAAMISAFSAVSTVLPSIPVLRRVVPLLETETEKSASMASPELSGQIELNQVTFSYPGSSVPAVADVSLKVAPGEFIAVVGPSGSGKSTLAKLLLGFLSPSSGSIFLDDRDLRSLHLRCVRQQIGTVLQDGELMHGSIALNILGASDKTIEQAWEVARLVSLAEDIEKIPMQMHTVISEGAKTISGGQKQRILIARALINRPKILILDEATSALDNQTQAEVQSNLERLTMTRIVIAHRLSTVANADRVVVMSAGRVVQQGRPEDVLRQEGYFKTAAMRQSV